MRVFRPKRYYFIVPADPLLLPLVSIAAGILLSRWVRFEIRELLLALPALFALTLLAYRHSKKLAYAACLVAVCLGGILTDVLHRPSGTPSIDANSQETVLLSGCVVDPPIFYEGRDQFTVQLAPKAAARASLTLREGELPPDLHYGQLVEFEAKVRPIRNFQNPGSFDFAAYSARREIYWNAAVRTGAPVKVLPGKCGSAFMAPIFQLRTLALQRIEALYPDNPYAVGMMEAILIGETTKLEKVWTEHFRRTGTFHALVISGMHISVLAGTMLFLMRICFVPEIPALCFTAVAAWVYALVSGYSAPVVRGAGAFSLYLVGRYFYRERRLMNLLAAVAIGYLLYDPGQIFESSFQLSFLSVAAIGVLAAPIMKATSQPFGRGLENLRDRSRDLRLPPRVAAFRLELRLLAETIYWCLRIPERWTQSALSWSGRLFFYVFDMVLLSTVIQIGLALPMAIYFHRISFSGLSANVIIVPLLSLVIPIGFLAIFTGWHLPAAISASLLVAAEKVANWHVRWEPDRRVPDPPVWLSLAFVVSLLLLTFAIRRTWHWRVPAVALVLGLFATIFLHPFPPKVAPKVLEISAIDVGQGDGLLIAFPDGKLMMVDGGGFPNFGNRKVKSKLDVGEDVISPYLWSRSIRKLDVIVCTHAHEDHTGGIGALIDNFHPTELWTGANGDNPVWAGVRARAEAQHVKIHPMLCCGTFPFGGARVDVLAPSPDYQPLDEAKNNDSLVFRLTYGKHSFLLTGDMEKATEAQLYADGKLAHVDVLKVPHHGSKTSSTDLFLDAVQPSFAIISDGFENSFHHPNKDVLQRLVDRRAAILRTDQLGLITIRSDGQRISMETSVVHPKGPMLSY